MNRNFTKWVVSQVVMIVMLGVAGSALAVPGDQLLHNSNNLGTKYGTWGGSFTCSSCHNKTTINVKRVLDSIQTPWTSSARPVVFNSMTSFGTDNGARTTSTKVCQVCHTKTAVHRYNKPVAQADSNHQSANQTDCTTCHSHASAFAPTCNTCHGSPPNSQVPAVFGANGLVNDTVNSRGPTNALVATQPGAHMVHDALGMQCAVCHSKHNALHSSTQLTDKSIDIGFRISKANWASFGNYSVLDVTFTGTNTLSSGYTWNSTEPGRTIINTAANTATCNVYCHGNWPNANGGSLTASWVGGSAEKACGACHGARPDGTNVGPTPTTAAHVRHADNGAGNLGLTCDKCHGAHPDNSHVTGSVKWAFTGLSTSLKGSPRYKGSLTGETGNLATKVAFGQCTNLYCHSDVQGAGGIGKPANYASVTWSGTLLNCGSCHKGAGGAYSLISSASHRAHVSRGYTYNCDTCHTGAGDQQPNHADGLIQVSIPTGGTYSQAGQAAGNGYGTCSTTTCHASIVPTWGTPLAANCLGCHGGKSAGTLSGAHNKHMNDATFGGGFNCIDCHASVVSDNVTISKKSLHTNSLINYSGALSGKFSGVSPVTCATQYCHTNGRGLATIPSSWNNTWSAGTACYQCHGNAGSFGAPITGTINSHPKHAPLATDCWKCHFKTASKTTGQLVAGQVDHLDKTIDARLAKPFTYANTSGVYSGGKCSTTYCHGTAATPNWGTAGSNCNSCHKSKANVTVGLPGAHKFHLSSSATNYNFNAAANTSSTLGYNFNCATCHATGGGKATHINGPVSATSGAAEVFFGYTSAIKKGAYVSATVQGVTDNGFTFTNGAGCNTTYCHSNGQAIAGSGSNGLTDPNWATTTGAGTCTQCHGSKLTAGLSGAHAKHVNDPTLGGSFGCVECHANTVSSDTAISAIGYTKHVNKLINYSGTKTGAKFAGASPVTCSVQYCHSNGKGTAAPVPAWGSTFSAGTACYQCHGRTTTTGAPDNVASDSHTKHAPTAAQCYYCHRLTASKTVAGQLVTGTTDHLDANIDARMSKVSPYTNFSGVLNVNKSCSSTYCHGSAATPIWGVAGSTNCNSCHKSKGNVTVGLPGAHKFHVMSTAGNYNFNGAANTSTAATYNYTCAACHAFGAGKSTHSNGPPTATSGVAEVFFGYTSATKKGAYVYATVQGVTDNGFTFTNGTGCNTTYCHSNGQGSNGLTNPDWAVTTGAGTCAQCHGNEASGAGVLSGAHNKHVTTAMFGGATLMKCKDCHATTISNTDNRTLADKSKHINKFVDYSGRYARKNKTCATIYCHSNGKGTYQNMGTANWATTNAVVCSFCHDQANLSNAHTIHINSTYGAITCNYCHSGTAVNNTSVALANTKHIDGFVNISSSAPGLQYRLQNTTFKNVGGSTCNNISCHGGAGKNATWGGAPGCIACHPSLSTGHDVHVGAIDLSTSNNPAARIFYDMTANRSPNTNDTVKKHGFGCASCHPINVANHMNGTLDIDMSAKGVAGLGSLRFLNSTTAGKLPLTYSFVNKQCNNIYCHSNASRVPAELTYTLTPAWGGSFGAGDRCAKCHLNQPKTGAHGAHAVGNHTFNNATSLAGSTMLDGNIFSGKVGKVLIANRKNTAHGNPNNSTTISCNICHKTTMNNPQNDQNYKCRQCHVLGSNGGLVKGNATISSLQSHVNGTRDITFDPIFVKSKAQVRPKGASANNSGFDFYSGVWKRNTYKNMSTLSYDTAKVRLDIATTYIYSTPQNSSCSNVVCHNGASPKWNLTDYNDPNKCMDCHSKL